MLHTYVKFKKVLLKRPYYIWIVTASSAQGPVSKMSEQWKQHINY